MHIFYTINQSVSELITDIILNIEMMKLVLSINKMQIQQHRKLRKQTLLAPRPAYYKAMASLPTASADAYHKQNKKFTSKNTMKAEILEESKQPEANGKFTTSRYNHDKTMISLLQNQQPKYRVKTQNDTQVFRKKPQFVLKKNFNKIMDENDLKNLLKSLMKQIGQMLKDLNNFVKLIDTQKSGKYNCQINQFSISFTEINKKVREAEKGIDQMGLKQMINNILQYQVKKTEKMKQYNKQNLYNNQISIIAPRSEKSNQSSKLGELNTTWAYMSNSKEQIIVDHLCSQLCNWIFKDPPEQLEKAESAKDE